MDSACCVYAIVGRDTPLPAVGTEPAAAALATVAWRELAAVTGPMPGHGAGVTVQGVLHHEAIVEAVRRHGPALPVRYGTVFRDATSVASALAARYEPLAADLRRLGDKVEVSVTALWAAPSSGDEPARAPARDSASAAPGGGARYLLARAAELRREEALRARAAAVARALDERAGGVALERRLSLVPTARIALRAAYLLDAAAVSAFRAALETMRASHDELRLLLTGPWPPYSFVRRADAESGGAPGGRLAALRHLLTDDM